MSFLSFENYVYLHSGLIVLGAVFMFWRKPNRGMRLKLKSSPKSGPLIDGSTAYVPTTRVRERSVSLNVHFNHNGHSFDAYEVLGVPAGSSWDRVQQAFATSLTQDRASQAFYEAAYRAIEMHLKAS